MDLAKLLAMLTEHSYGSDYIIECREHPIIIIKNQLLEEEIKGVIGEAKEEYVELTLSPHNEPLCIFPRIQELAYSEYLREVCSAALLSKIYSCTAEANLYIFLNDLSDKFLYVTYVYHVLKHQSLNIKFPLEKLTKYSILLARLKDLKQDLSYLKKKLEVAYDENTWSKYTEKVRELDEQILQVKKLWDNDKSFFDAVYRIVSSTEKRYSEVVDYVRENIGKFYKSIEELLHKWIGRYNSLLDPYRLNYSIVPLSKLIGIGEREQFNSMVRVTSYLKERCKTLLFIDGEEAEILREILDLDYKVLVLPD